jgi:hypothetical protein
VSGVSAKSSITADPDPFDLFSAFDEMEHLEICAKEIMPHL